MATIPARQPPDASPGWYKDAPNDGNLVDLSPLYKSDQAVQRKVLVDNPHRLYRFAG